MTIAASDVRTADLRWFYVWIASFCALVLFAGFWPTYWGPVATGNFVEGAPVLHIHALIYTAWPLLFLAQTLLAATGRMEWHRALGLLGVALASAMIFVGYWTTVYSIQVQTAASDAFQARTFSIVSFAKIAFFAVVVALALAHVTRPETHKRLMVLATVSLLQTALARILFALFAPDGSPQRPGLGPPPPMTVGIPTSIALDLILLTIVLIDWRATKRLHPVYVIGGLALVAIQIIRIPLSTSQAWHALVEWLVWLAGS